MRVSSNFCGRLYTACASLVNGSSAANEWCTSELHVQVMAGTAAEARVHAANISDCFNSAIAVQSIARSITWLLPMLVSIVISHV